MFTTLVVALDLDADGDRALPVVQALARTGPVRVELVTVSSPGTATTADAHELRRRARQFGWDRDGWSIVYDIDAASGLVQHAMRRDDTLLVMATSTREPWMPARFGGLTRDVLRHTDRPVLLIGPHVTWSEQPASTTLVTCIDTGDSARRVVPAVVAWQRTFASTSPQLAEVVAVDGDPSSAAGRLDDLADLLAAHHVPADTHVVRGEDPVRALRCLADRFDGAVHVATSARYTGDRLHWHRATQELIQRAGVPVLVVPARAVPVVRRIVAADSIDRPAWVDPVRPTAATPS